MSEYYYQSTTPTTPTIKLSDDKIKVYIDIDTGNGRSDWHYHDNCFNFDLLNDPQKPEMFMDMCDEKHIQGLMNIAFENNRPTGGRIWIYKFEIFLIWNENFFTANELYCEDWGGTKILTGNRKVGSLRRNTIQAENDMFWRGTAKMYVRVKYRDKDKNYFTGTFEPILCLGFPFNGNNTYYTNNFIIHDVALQSINVNNPQKDFYINENFSLGTTGEVKGTYKYVVNGSTFEEKLFSNFTSNPSVGSKLKNPDTSKPIEQGFKRTVTISYGGKSTTYDINVKGVKSFTKPELSQYIKLGAYTGDLENTVFTYDDNTTTSAPTNVSALVTPGFVGYFDVSYNSYASKIKQYGRWGSAEDTRFEDE